MKNITLKNNENLAMLKFRAEATLWNMKNYERCSLLALPMNLLKEYKDKMFECSKEYSELLDKIARLEAGLEDREEK